MNDLNQKEQVGETIEVVTEDIVSPLLTTPVLKHPIQQQEVIPQEEVILKPQENSDTNLDHVASVDVPNRYELPLRNTRGIPPSRYDPEFEAQRSRYLVSKESDENLSHTAVAFNTSLYSNDVPKILKKLSRIQSEERNGRRNLYS